jgi:hypothetical protein
MVRKHRAEIAGDTAADTLGAAAAKATDNAKTGYETAWDRVMGGWKWAVGQVRAGGDAAGKGQKEL